jgi:hypothetical protein
MHVAFASSVTQFNQQSGGAGDTSDTGDP